MQNEIGPNNNIENNDSDPNNQQDQNAQPPNQLEMHPDNNLNLEVVTPEQTAKLQELTKQLELSDKQLKSLKKLQADFADPKNKAKLSPDLLRAKMAQLQAAAPGVVKSSIATKSSFDPMIKQLYGNKTGFNTSYSPQEKEAAASKQIFLTYGEILSPSVDYLLDLIKMTESDVFVDLGSGIGKLCLQVFMRSKAKQVYGIEAFEPRYAESVRAYKKAKRKKPELFTGNRELILLQQNFLDFDFSNSTVLFMCATCFSAELMEAIGNKINDHPSIRCVLSTKKIPNLVRLQDCQETNIRTSWNATSPCNIYT